MSERTINFLVTTAFPNAYFLDQGLWRASADYSHLNLLREVGDVQNRARVSRRVWDAINDSWQRHNDSLHRQDDPRVVSDAEFVLLHYDRVLVSPGYDTFVCPRRDCERVFTRDVVEANNYRCTEHGDQDVMQLAHLFVHADCGTVSQITPRQCWNRFDGKYCNAQLRLHIEYQQMGASYWWCPHCRYERRISESRQGDDRPGWNLGILRAWCPTCSVDGQPAVRMRLTTARKVYKPQRVDVVDMPEADAQILLQEWFGEEFNEEAFLAQLPIQLQNQYRNNPRSRQELRRMYQSEAIGEAGIPKLIPTAQEELANCAGARSAVIRTMDELAQGTRDFLLNDFGIRVSLLDDLAIVRATYGYLVGGATPEEAILQVFPMGAGRYAVLTQRLPTEALLFELDAKRVLAWLHDQGLADGIVDATALRQHLVSCESDDGILERITGLAHTASHGLRRSSERYTGMGRDVVDELLFPRGLSWAVYNNRGSELGMFTTTFEGRLREWLQGTRYDLQNCPFDPICMNEEMAACPGCLHVGERGCTTLWNRYLDRRYLVQLPTSTMQGYWAY